MPSSKSFPIASRRSGLMAGASPFVLGLVAVMAASTTAQAQAVNMGGGGFNNIVADGRTDTSVTVSGATTSISTNSVAGGTGFNSFSDFQQAANTRVDLYVPDGAGNLVNIVRNGPVVIDGLLNSYKDGQIGGNVFFASSQGFVVGASGVVNVGSLSVTTPTADFIENVIRPDGSINDALASNLLRGVVPLSADGLISIAGTINAKGGVSLQGHEVNLAGGTITIDGRLASHREILDSAVNVGGIAEGTALAMRDGVISIVASGNAKIAGVIDASAKTPGHQAGAIEVKAGGDIVVDGVSRLSADGGKVVGFSGDGGSVAVVATDTLLVADNAKFTARGKGAGAGGFVELSGHTAIIGGVNVDLGSDQGKSGTLLFDPFDLYIGGLPPGATGNYSVSNNIASNGANVALQADNSITVIANGVIDTRSAAGASGNISLDANLITIADGARLQADVTNGSGAAAGNITLKAERTTNGTSRIVIGTGTGTGPIIAGHDVTLLASANVDSGLLLLSLPVAKAEIAIGGNSTITASGAFKADAIAKAAGSLTTLPIGVVVSDVLASVDVGGAASITAASATLKADATTTSRIGTTSLAPSSSAADGAVAVSTVTSKALVNVGGTASISTTGALDLIAHNAVVSEANATPNGARFGASVAVSVVKAETSVTVDGAAALTSDSLKLDAQTTATVKVTAAAAQGGGGEPEAGSKANEYLDDSKYGKEASTSDGKVSVVGGLAISDLSATTLAKYASSVAATVTNATEIKASSTTGAELVADGAAVDSTTGVGVAVGINLARVSTAALAGGALNTGSLSLGAAAGGNVFSTTATSGAGAQNVGVAGSLASNIVDTEARAALEPSAAVTLTGSGSVAITASNESDSKAIAQPTDTGVTGGKVGVGVSAAINVVANRATAEIGNNVALSNADAVEVSATGTFGVESEAKAGSSGGISVTPALALNMVSNATTARVGTGGLMTIGSLALGATQQASSKATVTASAAGSKAAVGAGLAIALVDDVVTGSVGRSLTATGAVSVVGMGVSLSELTVSASASGAKAADDAGAAPAGSKPDVDSQVDGQLGSAKAKQDNAGVGSTQQRSATGTGVANKDARSASTSEGKVSVAAAVGVNVQSAKVVAEIADAISVQAGGALTVRAIGNTDGKVTADGSAVSADGVPESQVGIGAAVAVNKVASATTARLGDGAHTVGGLTVEALKRDVAALVANPASTATRSDTYLASATSGAGGSKVGIAGSLGLNLIDSDSDARIAGGAVVNVTGAGAVTLSADNQGSATVKALPVDTGATGGKVGVGVSAAINVVANRATAELADGAVLIGAGDLSLAANGVFATEAEAKAGAAGGVSVTPALALSLINNSTVARIGTGNSTLSAGSVALSAVQDATTTTKAAASATGATAAVGMSLALALVNDTASATTARSLTSTGDVSFTAQSKSVGTMSAEATASGAKPADDSGQAQGEKDVDGKVDDQLTGAQSKQSAANIGNSAQQSSTSQGLADKNSRSAKSSEGKVAVAAAAAINVTRSSAIAEVPDAVVINAGGRLLIESANTTSGTLTADGSAVAAPSSGTPGSGNSGQSQVGVGVAVAVNAIDKTNTARLGVAAHQANGLTISARQFGTALNPDLDTISATASSGAGGSKVGIAGSLALNVVVARTNALVAGGASINAGTGAVAILADQRVNATASAQPIKTGATGGKVGVGASVALNTIFTTTSAVLSDGAVLTNGAGLAVTAKSVVSTTTKAAAGASGGVAVDAVVAFALLNDQTIARIGTSTTGIATNGAVTIAATSGGDHLAQADGNTKAGSVGVGASAALIFGAGAQGTVLANTSLTSASLARNLTATSLGISASAVRGYTAEATATAKGGFFSDTDAKKNETTGGTAASANSLDKTKDSQKGTDNGGKVTVAAAAGIAAAQDVVSATIQGVTVNTGAGAVSVAASNNVGMATGGSGLALNSQSQVGVGIGVALGILNNATSATIEDGSSINQSGSVSVTANALENTAPGFIDKATAVAIAGASSSKVSVAGALAVAISTSSTKAIIGDNVALTSTGAVNVAVDNTSKLSARSLAGAYTSGNVGVGASVATIYSQHSLTASIGAGTNVNAGSVSVTTNNRKVNQPTIFAFTSFSDLKDRLLTGELLGASNYYAEAMGGAASTGAVAVQGSFAVMVFDDKANASIGRSQSANGPTTQTVITTAGAVELKSESDLTSKAFAGGIAVGRNAGVGVSSAVIVSSGTNRALFAAGTVINSGSVTALAKAGQDVKVFGISAAGGNDAGIAGVATVVTTENTTETLVDERARIAATGAVSLNAQNDFAALSVAGGAAAGGQAGLGAAASVVTINNVTRAALANAANAGNGVQLDAGGLVTIGAKASETAQTFTAAGAASKEVAIGAGAAVYVLGTRTEAYVGSHARLGQVTKPTGLVVSAEDITALDSLAGAAAGAGTVGAGAGASVGVIIKTTYAGIAADARVRSGDVRISAKSAETARSIVAGVGIGGTAGVAGALGVYTVVNKTTAEIGSNAIVLADNNVGILADDDVDISFLTGALAGSGTAAVGASAAVTVIHADTIARIASGASVTALGLAGPGVTYITGYTPTLALFGTGAAPNITAPALTGYSAASGGDVEVTSADEALRQGIRLLLLERSTTANTATGQGVVVNASGQAAVRSLVVGAAGGGTVGVAISGNVPVILANISASIADGAKVNVDNAGASGGNQSVTVAAASDVYRIGIAGSVGIGTVGIGGGLETSVIKVNTGATIGQAQVNAKRDVVVAARATQDYAGAAAAASVAAGAAVSGGFSVLALESNTQANIAGTVFAGGNVVVLADDITRSASLAGSAAVDVVGAGVGGSVSLSIITKRVSAAVAANAQVTALGNSADVLVRDGNGFTGTRSARGLVVAANSNESLFTLGIAGAGGFYAGFAGAISLQLLDIATTATIGDNATINGNNAGANSAQDVTVVARNSSSIAAIDGGIAVSLGAGVSGAVDIGILRNTTAARIGDGATVNAARRVDVLALQNIATSSTVISASGGLAGVAAGISVYSLGDGITVGGEGDKQINSGGNLLGYVQGQLGNNTTGTVLASSSDQRVRDIGASATQAKSGIAVSLAPTTVAGISASVGNASIKSGGATNILTRDTIATKTAAGAVAVGAVGLGAGIGIVTVSSTNAAQVSGLSTLNVGALSVDANSSHDLRVVGVAGTLGYTAALQASLAIITDNSTTRSFVAGSTVQTPGAVVVNAVASRTGKAETYGAALSVTAAAGLSYAAVNLGGAVEAKLARLNGTATTIGSAGARANSIAVTASSANSATADTKAVSGGLGLALLGALAEAEATTTVSSMSDGATIYAANETKFDAQSAGRATADAKGLSVGLSVAAGGSLAKARVAEAVSTTIGAGSIIDSGSIVLGASVTPNLASPAVMARAWGSSGALVGLSATDAQASNTSSANVLASGSALRASGQIRAASLVNSAQHAEAWGLAVGIVAVGSNTSLAKSTTVSQAILRDMISVTGGDLRILANGSDNNWADATSGSGGLIAGAAASARTVATNTTRALVETTAQAGQFTLQGSGEVQVLADHATIFGGKVDSIQASIVGASGATVSHSVDSTVEARLSDRTRVRAASLAVQAMSAARNFFLGEAAFNLRSGGPGNFNGDTAGWNVNSGSGGLINLPAGSSAVTVNHSANALIGSNADILLVPAASNLGKLTLEAYTETVVHQKGKLDSGGAIALADSDIRINVVANARAAIGAATKAIVSVGDVAIAAWGNMHMDARSAATTYGLAGAPSGKAHASYIGNNTIDIGESVTLLAAQGTLPATVGEKPTSGTVSISAGTGLAGEAAKLSVRTTVDLFNKTAIPISTTPDARSTVLINSALNIADSQNPANPSVLKGVLAAGDITLRAVRGSIDASAVGTGKDIYREALAKIASAISNAFGGGDVTFDYHGGTVSTTGMGIAKIDGLVATGFARHQNLLLEYLPNCAILTNACVTGSGSIAYTVGGPEAVGTDILKRVSELRELKLRYKDDPIALGAYNNEIRFLEDKLVALGLGTFVGGVFTPGTYAGPSPRETALALVEQNKASIAALKGQFGGATTGVVSADTADWGYRLADGYTNATFGIDPAAHSALSAIAGLSKHSTLMGSAAGSSAAYKTMYNGLDALIQTGKNAANTVGALTADIADRQNTIAARTLDLQNAQTAWQQALLDGRSADAATELAKIQAAQDAIFGQLTNIAINSNTIKTQAKLASDTATAIKNNLTTLMNAANAGTSADNTITTSLYASPVDPASSGALRKVINGVDGPGSGSDFITAYYLGLDAAATVTANKTNVLQVAANATSLETLVQSLRNLTTTLAANTETAKTASSSSGTPMAYSIDVADTIARLGDINVVTDRLVGSPTGSLRAPGDAKIEITNNTANTLKLGNLLIPAYDAGHVRLNGVAVSSNAEVNAIQGGNFSNLGSIVSSDGSSRPLVSITSNYNPESLAYYNPASAQPYLNTPRIAPDIILKLGKTIDNVDGAVNIASAAGNIYVNGTINAGSVNILAKNGDFVTSYVNGFNHVGGDPASFNSPTRAGEAGNGITANGAVSIAARFININSTIQSGIANWTLNLNGSPTLTTNTAANIGLTQTQIDTAIQNYKTAIAAASNPANVPSPIITLTNSRGQSITLNMAPAGMSATEITALNAAIGAYMAANGSGTANPLVTLSVAGVSKTINIKDFLSAGISGRLEFSMADATTYTQQAGGDGVFTVISPTSNIGVAYDTRNTRFVVDGTSVRGGYIQLYGQIMNTANSAGALKVLDGFGTININNTSGIPVVLQTLSAGADNSGTGRGTAGKIDITDIVGVDTTIASSPVINFKRTVYTRDYDPGNAAGQVKLAIQTGHLDNQTGDLIVTGTGSATGGDRTASYATTPNQRYVWTTGDYYNKDTNFTVKKDQLFGADFLTISTSTQFASVNGPHVLDTYRLPNGTYVTVDRTQSGNAGVIQTNQGIVLTNTPGSVANSAIAGAEFVSSTYAYMNEENGPNKTGESRACNWWTLCIASKVTLYYSINQKYTTITTNSLKADNPIAVEFIGSNTGGVTVNSASDVVLMGAVKASNGSVAITSTNGGSIVQGDLSALITGKSVTLSAAGSVGGITYAVNPAAPIRAAVAIDQRGGALNASAADGNVVITARGALSVDQISAAGNVHNGKGAVILKADGSITGVNANALIQAPRVSLTSVSGAIGSTAANGQLHVNTGFSTAAGDRVFGDPAINPSLNANPYLGLTASARGDIGIRATGWSGNADGTMLVDQVVSSGGNVRLSSTGHILDNNPVESIDQRTYAQLLGYWNSLGLVVSTTENANKQAANLAAYERSMGQSYAQYWQVRASQADGGQSYDAGFAYKVAVGSQQYAALNQQFSNDLRAANPAWTDAQVAQGVSQKIAAYEAEQTSLYHDLNGKVGGLTASYNANYTYTASATEQAAMSKGASWTERELAFSLSPGALKTVTATNPVVKAPNVAGRSVTIEAQTGVGETIGAGTANVGVSIAGNLDPSLLTIEQRVALASAERSDLLLTVIHNGASVVIPLGTDYDSMTSQQKAALDAAASRQIAAADMTITVLSKRPLNFNAVDQLNVAVAAAPNGTLDTGTAHLASRGDAALGTISVQGETRIKVIGNIFNATTSSIATGNLVLEAAQGGIGSSTTPLRLTTGNATFTGRAQLGAYVNFNGNGVIDTVYSPNAVNLKASGALLNANNDSLINVLGKQVTLDAGTTIGSGARALNVGNNLGGGITATAGGLINLFGPVNNFFAIKTAVSSTGAVTLTAGNNGSIEGLVQGPGRVTLTAGNRFTITSAGQVRSIANDVAVGGGVLKMHDGAILLADVGRVLIDVTGDAQVTGIRAGSSSTQAVDIRAGGRIYAGNATLRSYDIAAENGGVTLKGLGIGDKTLTAADAVLDTINALRILSGAINVTATGGSAHLSGLSPVTELTASVAGNLGVTAAGKLILTTITTSGYQQYAAQGQVVFNSLVATGPNGNVTMSSANGDLAGGNITASGSTALTGNGVAFGTIQSGIDSRITSTRDIIGTAQIAGNAIYDYAGTDQYPGYIRLNTVRAKSMTFDATGGLQLPDLEAEIAVTLAAPTVTANITQVPSGPAPLLVTLTGPRGRLGTRADVSINAPAGVIVPQLYFTDVNVVTTANSINLLDAYVPGQMTLVSPLQTILANNRSPGPVAGNNIQLYQMPGLHFGMALENYHTSTNAFIVKYDVTAQATFLVEGLPFHGVSLVRDTVRAMFNGDPIQRLLFAIFGPDDKQDHDVEVDTLQRVVTIDGVDYPITIIGNGKPVQLGALDATVP